MDHTKTHHGSLCGRIKQIKYDKNIYLYILETEFISIGPCCYTTEYIKNSGHRNHSYPFDWIFQILKWLIIVSMINLKCF